MSAMGSHVLALDSGTTSTKAFVFSKGSQIVSSSAREHQQILPKPGYVEHSPDEIWTNAKEVIRESISAARLREGELKAIGITNQRETTILWDRNSGIPISNAITWQDTRTQSLVDSMEVEFGSRASVEKTGLPLSTYFSASKIRWLLDNVRGARSAAESGDIAFGTVDTWLLWKLTGGPNGGIHVTDVTNASRTLLMDLHRCQWDHELLDLWNIPPSILPEIRSSSEIYGVVCDPINVSGLPISGILGDQQAATFGQVAFERGESKNTYGTGNFLLVNTGDKPVYSEAGLLTTVAYKLGDAPASFALEGSVAVTGSLVQWLRDNLGLFSSAEEVEGLAKNVSDNGGCYFVPAFSGLFAPHWRPDARGVIVGLTRFINRGHIARAALEATAFQTLEVLDAVAADSGLLPSELRVDGGMVDNQLLMQFQADMLDIPIIVPSVSQTTALGAAFAAGLAVGVWKDKKELRLLWSERKRFIPDIDVRTREKLVSSWKKAVTKTFSWVD